MSVTEKLKALMAVQQVDLEILELKRAGEVHPKRLAELDAELQTAQASVEAERQRLADNERQRREKETESQSEKDKIKKWEGRLAEQRTTREYAALAREIDIAKKAQENMADDVKALVEEANVIKAGLGDREADLRRRMDATAAERSQLKQSVDSLSSQIKELEEKRAALVAKVDAGLASRYDTVRRSRGSGVAPVVNGICKGCNMRILPQLYNVLRSGATIETCPSCQRLIYANELFAESSQQ